MCERDPSIVCRFRDLRRRSTSKLSHMHHDKVLGVFTRQYANYTEAQLGHMSIFEKLLSKSATVI